MAPMMAIFEFQMKSILANFYLAVTRLLPTKFQVNWPFYSEKNSKVAAIPTGNDFSCFFFYLQVTSKLHNKFQVNWPFGSGERAKLDFQTSHGSHLGIFDRNDFSYFLSTSHPDASYQVSSPMAFWFRRIREK